MSKKEVKFNLEKRGEIQFLRKSLNWISKKKGKVKFLRKR